MKTIRDRYFAASLIEFSALPPSRPERTQIPGTGRRLSWTVAVAAALPVIACSVEPAPGLEQVVAEASTLVTAESGLLGSPVDLEVGADRAIYVLDGQLSQILVLGSDGHVARTIGREGSGPEELRGPSALALSADTIRVVDWGNARVQRFSARGEHVGSTPLSPAVRGPHAIRGDGWIAVGTMGFDSVLAAWFDERGERRGTFGAPVVPPVAMFAMADIKRQIASGEIPDLLRNEVLPAFGRDGLWLAFAADARVQRYDSAGQLRADAALDDPTFTLIRDEFFQRNRRDSNARGFHALHYPADLQEVDRQLWLLLQVPDSLASVLLVFDPGGAVRRRVVFGAVPGATGFAVDRAARRILLVSQPNATLASAPLPRGLLP